MIRTKKGYGAGDFIMIFAVILIFSIISIISVIIGHLYYAIGNDYVVLPMYNISQSFNSTAEFNTAYDNTVINYQGLDLSFIDDLWFLSYAVLVITSFTMAYSIRNMNYFTWLSLLTYGLMFLLFVAGLFSILLNFLYNDILLNLFINLAISTPKLAYYVTNFGFILLIHAAGLLLTSQLDFDFAFIMGRKRKEQQAIESIQDDELI